jgi:citrate lyase subunit gamma (acyl carrier protein)
VLDKFEVTGAHVTLKDQGALDCTIRARVETALRRAAKED